MFLATTLEIILEIVILLIVLLGLGAIASVFLIRDLRKTYKEMYRQQSRFDIELRKVANLMSKVVTSSELKGWLNLVIKELPYEKKKQLLQLLFELYESIDLNDEKYTYLVETYDNLQEARRLLDAKILLFNQKISYFPFNLYAKVMKLSKREYYTHQ